ncbi:type IV toxin-antitoxin system AbiEi family antitoxin domain-containing protein [Amycolatopsis eburnea]|uniref:type IV toxin-antitoxin system AbiEi family antitoxin domain-containing protein n=1 Tax=Amycolatopsis eburnea TaxID=2267691 RepID=UPI0026B2C3A4
MDKAFELLGDYVGEQWGMVTARQAKSLGIDAVTLYRLKDAGFLDLVRRGVYVATTAAAHRHQAEQAAWLALRPTEWAWNREPLDPDDGVLSHGTSARLHGFGELVENEIAFTVPRRRTSRDTDLWFKIDDSLTDDDVTLVDGLPVTTMLRTVCDLLDQHIDGSHIATIIREAVEAGQLRLDTLADRITPYARRYRVRPLTGTALLEHLLEQIDLTVDDLATRPRPRRPPSAESFVNDFLARNGHLPVRPAGHGQAKSQGGSAAAAWTEPEVQQIVAAAMAPAADELRANLRSITAPTTDAWGSALAEMMRNSPAMEEFRKKIRAITSPDVDGLSRALATIALQGPGGEELRQQIARSVAAGPPLIAAARQDASRDELDTNDD